MPVASEAIQTACADVRDDSSSTIWAMFKYDDKNIIYEPNDHGDNYDDLLNYCTDDGRFYAYVRVETGDEMSKRAKFVLITWVGPGVPALKKAKVSTDKGFVKEACPFPLFADQAGAIVYPDHADGRNATKRSWPIATEVKNSFIALDYIMMDDCARFVDKQWKLSFAIEVLTDDKGELSLENVKEAVKKAGGANYGTGQ